jgi:parallel beta-helix repeat protein
MKMKLSKRTKLYPLLTALALVVALTSGVPVLAQEGDPPTMPGSVFGAGTHFEVTDSDWLNVSVDSSSEIILELLSFPTVIEMTVEAASGVPSAEITLGGLEAGETYWKYEDAGLEGVAITADASGSASFSLDLSARRHVRIQPGQSTWLLYDGDTNGDCASIGVWSNSTKTCTLTGDVSDGIRIMSSDITLDGAGHQVTLPTFGSVAAHGVDHVTVKNLRVVGTPHNGTPSGTGIQLAYSSNSRVESNTVSGTWNGIYVVHGGINMVVDNVVDGTGSGLLLGYSDYNTLSGNEISDVRYYGVYLFKANNSTITGNTISRSAGRGLWLYGYVYSPDVYSIDYTSKDNEIYRNNFVGNATQVYLFRPTQNIGNLFHRPTPDGGNYYSDFDVPAEGCFDVNEDGFCDSPYIFPEGQDDLPWTTPSGWEGPTDETPPEITPSVSGTLGDNDWYVGDVTVSWNVTDPESDVTEISGCDTTVIDADTDGTDLTCTASSAGGTSSESVTIKRDATAPTASASASPGPNANGWNNSDVTVSFDGSDALSGIDACAPPVVLSGEGAEQSTFGTCTDLAGNISAPATASDINIDRTPPTLTIVVPQLYDVQPVGTALDFSAEDTLSGLAGPAMAILTSETETLVLASREEPGVGVYNTVEIKATDLAGNTASSEPRLLVIYDPTGGFVTGGGWIWSEAGWCHLDEVCVGAEGKAHFGFVSKYKKGASVPTGNTQFNFNAGGLNFHSDTYEWLVVNQGGANAQYKGTGTINGEGEYKFMLWAGDRDPDTFRIRIWEEDDLGNETDIYDNGFNQPIGGGNIVVHTKK